MSIDIDRFLAWVIFKSRAVRRGLAIPIDRGIENGPKVLGST